MRVLTAKGIIETGDSYGRRLIEQGKAVPAPEAEETVLPETEAENPAETAAEEAPQTQKPETEVSPWP